MRTRAGLLVALALFCAGCVINRCKPCGPPEGVRTQGPIPHEPRAVLISPTVLKPDGVKNVEGLADAP